LFNVQGTQRKTRRRISFDAYSRRRLKRIQGPLFGSVGLSCTDCQEQALRGGAIGTDSLLQLTG
jgi:hypothetical protein